MWLGEITGSEWNCPKSGEFADTLLDIRPRKRKVGWVDPLLSSSFVVLYVHRNRRAY